MLYMKSASTCCKEHKTGDMFHKGSLPKVMVGVEPFLWEAVKEGNRREEEAVDFFCAEVTNINWSIFGRQGERQSL